jgi:hypothetical protein
MGERRTVRATDHAKTQPLAIDFTSLGCARCDLAPCLAESSRGGNRTARAIALEASTREVLARENV